VFFSCFKICFVVKKCLFTCVCAVFVVRLLSLRSNDYCFKQFSARPFPCGVGSLRKRNGCRLRNHDYFFHACAFIIRLNHPIYASTIVLFSLDNKKEILFFEEIVVIYLHMCIFCCKFVPDFNMRKCAHAQVQSEESPINRTKSRMRSGTKS
jgi:hypothetical protein